METVCGCVANPMAQMWGGLGRNPHSVSVGRNLVFVVRDCMGKEGDWIRGSILWKQCVDSLLIQWHGCGMD